MNSLNKQLLTGLAVGGIIVGGAFLSSRIQMQSILNTIQNKTPEQLSQILVKQINAQVNNTCNQFITTVKNIEDCDKLYRQDNIDTCIYCFVRIGYKPEKCSKIKNEKMRNTCLSITQDKN